MNINACFLQTTDNWKTPSKLMEALKEHGWIDTFPYMCDYDEFLKNYRHQKIYVNPPYSKLRMVANWVEDQIRRENQILLLIPARTDTKYFHQLLKYNPTLFLIKGRLKFNDVNSSAPFPSIIMYFDLWYRLPLYRSVTLEEFIELINDGLDYNKEKNND